MRQCYLVVNGDRQEYICDENFIGRGYLWKLLFNELFRVLPYLLQQSNIFGNTDLQNQEIDYLKRNAEGRIIVIIVAGECL
jgi:hypothetical protein